jgi:hypothetical protein
VKLGNDQVLIVAGVADEGSRAKARVVALLLGEILIANDASIKQRPDPGQIAVEIVSRRDFVARNATARRSSRRIVRVAADAELDAVVEASVLARMTERGRTIPVDAVEV